MRYRIRLYGFERADDAARKGVVKSTSDESRVWTDTPLLPRLTTANLLSFLLVVALVLSHHGVFGMTTHQLPDSGISGISGHLTAEHSAHPEDHEPDGHGSDGHQGGAVEHHAAVLLPLLLYLTYRLLRLEAQSRPTFSAPYLVGRSSLAAVVHRQGPAPSLLRVFRL